MQQANCADSTATAAASGGKTDKFSPSRRGILLGSLGGAAAALGLAAPVRVGAVPREHLPQPIALTSEVSRALVALRAHQRGHLESEHDAWLAENHRLESAFVQAQARTPHELAIKMRVALFEDLLSDTNAHNIMVFVMAQLERSV
ncbi:MAG: hypothetical protein FJ335_10090 [Sphingomonadales bacterium]|nr:hypothetical protein [Sphingomonadales bacterium]